MSETSSSTNTLQYPHPDTLQSAVKLAIIQDKPILMDYYQASLNKTDNCVLIGVRENKERLLVKSEEEYTSLISNVYKCKTEYIIVTENSIYIVSNSIPTKKIS